MAKTIRVVGLPDTTSLRGNWQVKVSGRRRSTHRKKKTAKKKARQYGDKGDKLWIHNRDGTISNVVTLRK